MTTIYTLGMNEGGNLQQLACPKCLSNIVKSLTIHPGTDCVEFRKRNHDGSTYGSYWLLNQMGVFKEMRSHDRLMEMHTTDVDKLANRMHELLYGKCEPHYTFEPRIDPKNKHLRQIVSELMTLHALERMLVDEGAIVLP